MLALLVAVTPASYFLDNVYADPLSNRSVTIASSEVSVTTDHNYAFTIPNANNIGSIQFEYCSNSPFIGTACTVPTGLNTSAASLSGQTGEIGFSINSGLTTANKILISRVPSVNLASQPATYKFSNVINPSDVNATTFVRISLYSSINGTGAWSDSGAVAFAVTRSITVHAFVPPYLTFCVGITVSNKCISTSGNFVNLGELSKTSANYSTSQFAGATNDPGGYSVFLAGSTMTSGTKIIPALLSPTTSAPGSSQYGINLVANSNPGVGQNKIGAGTFNPSADYAMVNKFKFVNQIIGNSPFSTNYNIVTVSYLVNVSKAQAPGVYTTTVTYIATAAF